MQRLAGLLVYHDSFLTNNLETVDQFGGYASYSIIMLVMTDLVECLDEIKDDSVKLAPTTDV